MTQPEPGKLDHGLAQAAIARFRDALIPFDAAALPGAGRQSAVSRHLASVAEAAKQRFQPEERGELRAQAFELEKQGGGVVGLLGFRADERVAGAFDRSQLRRHQRDPIELPAYFRLQQRRQLTAVAGSQRLESFETISPKRIVIPDALDSYLRDHRQNESNIVIEAPGRSSCSDEIDDALDGGVGAVIGGFEPAVWTVLRVRPVMEAAVGEGAAQALVEEEEEEGDLDALG